VRRWKEIAGCGTGGKGKLGDFSVRTRRRSGIIRLSTASGAVMPGIDELSPPKVMRASARMRSYLVFPSLTLSLSLSLSLTGRLPHSAEPSVQSLSLFLVTLTEKQTIGGRGDRGSRLAAVMTCNLYTLIFN
jgi:hypothetical protein